MKKYFLNNDGIAAAIALTIIILFESCSGSSTGSGGRSVDLSDNQSVSEWREENRTGVSAETGLMKSWPEEGPELIWMNKGLPDGYSSVSFGNGLIYLTGLEDKKDVLVALDSQGNIKWQTPYGTCWNPANPESRCTPTVEGERVYVSSGSGDIACIDGLTGAIKWSVRASETHKGTFGQWGIAESLIVDDTKVYFTPGGPETMTVAYDKISGDPVWKSKSLNDAPAYVSPVLISYAGRNILINISLHYVFGVDVSDGSILWNIDHTVAIDDTKSTAVWPDAPLIKCVTPLYREGKIYITGGYDHGSALIALNEDGTEASVVWTDEVLDVHHGGVVEVGGYIYGSNWLSNADGNWCCLDWNTGEKKYEEHWNCKGSIIAADGMLIIYDEKKGFVGLVNPTPEKFDLVSSFQVKEGNGPYWAHPVIHNGNLFLRHGKALMVYKIKS